MSSSSSATAALDGLLPELVADDAADDLLEEFSSVAPFDDESFLDTGPEEKRSSSSLSLEGALSWPFLVSAFNAASAALNTSSPARGFLALESPNISSSF